MLARAGIAVARFDGRRIVERLGVEFAFAGWCAEAAFGEGQEGVADIEADGSVLCRDASSVMPSRNGWPNRETVRIMSSSVSLKQESLKPMRAASARKISTIGTGFAGRGQRGARQLQIVVAVGEDRDRCVPEMW